MERRAAIFALMGIEPGEKLTLIVKIGPDLPPDEQVYTLHPKLARALDYGVSTDELLVALGLANAR